jgi:hypothetical protein
MVGPSFPYVELPDKITISVDKSHQQIGEDALTAVILCKFNGVPTMTLFLQALIANIARALEHRTICPPGRSRIKWMTSSKSDTKLSTKI